MNINLPNSHIFVGEVIPNPRLDSPAGTILGQAQKHWWKETINRSNTAWNIWGNSVQLMRLLLNLNAVDRSLSDVVLSADIWDAYVVTAAKGYGLAHVAESEITVQLVTISDVITDPTDSIPQLKSINFVCFVIVFY